MIQVLAVTDEGGRVVAAEWLARAEPVLRQLRPNLPASYAERMAQVFAGGGRMCVAVDGTRVLGVAVWRAYEDTHNGRKLYVDDLVTDEAARSNGVGRALVAYLEKRGRALGCDCLALDSGVQRQRAHQFYFREGMKITSFSFKKPL